MKGNLSGWTLTELLNFYLNKEKPALKAEYETKPLWRDTADVFTGLGHGGMGSLVWVQRPAAPVETVTGPKVLKGNSQLLLVWSVQIKIGLLMKKQHASPINLLPGCIKVKKPRKGIIYFTNRAAGKKRESHKPYVSVEITATQTP